MSKIKLTLIFLLVLCSDFLLAAENNIIFEKANELYHNKYYDSAATLYQQMIEDGYCHADLFYNAGNAYYRANRTGMAVWCFKKALQLNDNKNYHDNLQLAQKRIEKPVSPQQEIFFMQWWKSSYNLMSLNQWAVSTLVLFLISIVLLGMRDIMHKPLVSKNMLVLLFVITGFSLFFLIVKYYNDTYHYAGVIVKHNTAFSSESKSLSTTLSEGTEVVYMGKKNKGMMVKLPDGRTGVISPESFRKL